MTRTLGTAEIRETLENMKLITQKGLHTQKCVLLLIQPQLSVFDDPPTDSYKMAKESNL